MRDPFFIETGDILAGDIIYCQSPLLRVEVGATENAGVENAIRAKLQRWKMQEWKMRE